MGDGLLLLAWKNHSSTFSHVISSLREKDHYTDVTLACDGRFFPAHKIVLSACSQYFEDMLQNTPCKHPIIVLKDISSIELDALLNYMYAGEVSVSQNHLSSLIKAAESLRIKGLAVPDELGPSNSSEEKRIRSSMDDRSSPPAKKQRRERERSPLRETHSPVNRSPIPSPQPENERRRSYEGDTRTSSYEKESVVSVEKESRLERDPLNVKSEVVSVPSSPVLHRNEAGEHPDSSNVTQNTEVGHRHNEGVYGVKEEFIDSDTGGSGSVHDLSFSPAPVANTTTSPSLSIAALVSASAAGSTHTVANSRPSIDGANFEEHIRTLLYNPLDRRDILHSEVGYHRAGPSGLHGNLGFNVRDGYRAGAESYSSKLPEGYPSASSSHTSSSDLRTHQARLTHEVCSFPQNKGTEGDVTNKGGETQDPRQLYHCPYCKYSGQTHAAYLQHLAVHTGEKQFSCTFCSYRSARKSVVTKHMKTHHDYQN